MQTMVHDGYTQSLTFLTNWWPRKRSVVVAELFSGVTDNACIDGFLGWIPTLWRLPPSTPSDAPRNTQVQHAFNSSLTLVQCSILEV